MKIKYDFITNSSSTSYIFIFKGKDSNDLFLTMKYHWENFEIDYYEDGKTNVYEIIEYIKNENAKYLKIDDTINEIEDIIMSVNKWIENNNPINPYMNYLKDNYTKLKEDLECAKTKGFKSVYKIRFSDHNYEHGLAGPSMRLSKIEFDTKTLICRVYPMED